jgi:hypothetical protein
LNKRKNIRAPIIKITKIIFAILAAASEIPPKPKIAATTAIIIQITNHFNIRMIFRLDKEITKKTSRCGYCNSILNLGINGLYIRKAS